MNVRAGALLERALELSWQLLHFAEGGDSEAATHIDAERLQLLKSARGTGDRLDAAERALLREIRVLNDKSIGALEHHRRIKGRQLDVASLGRRAVDAYATTRRQR